MGLCLLQTLRSHIVPGTPGNEAPTTTSLPDDPVISTRNSDDDSPPPTPPVNTEDYPLECLEKLRSSDEEFCDSDSQDDTQSVQSENGVPLHGETVTLQLPEKLSSSSSCYTGRPQVSATIASLHNKLNATKMRSQVEYIGGTSCVSQISTQGILTGPIPPDVGSLKPNPPKPDMDILAEKVVQGADMEGVIPPAQAKHFGVGVKLWRCKLCGRFFGCRGSLMNHLNVHQGYRPYKCGQCHTLFYDKATLTRHLNLGCTASSPPSPDLA